MRHAVDRWREWGYQSVGCALAARAAQGLRQETDMPSTTIDRLLGEIDRGDWSPDARTVLIVDEAGMVGTRKLARLVEHCGEAGAKLVLVGDHRQLPEIESGGAFAELARAVAAVSLTDNRRQHDPVERKLLAELRDGDVDRAVVTLDELHRVQRFLNPVAAKRCLVADWFDTSRGGGRVIMTAMHRQDVDDLNRLARRRLSQDGLLSGPELCVDDVSFAVGDRVVALRNRHDLDLLNGDTAIVRQVDERELELLVTLDRGGDRRISASYIEAGDLTHGYAITVYKAQGMTVDEAFVYTDAAVYREAGYTALSRARQATHVYHVDDEPDVALAELLGRSRQKLLAASLLGVGHPSERSRAVDVGIEL
jgi:ATP-dependent exoDNAse (exonuclease V) alpha subunit